MEKFQVSVMWLVVWISLLSFLSHSFSLSLFLSPHSPSPFSLPPLSLPHSALSLLHSPLSLPSLSPPPSSTLPPPLSSHLSLFHPPSLHYYSLLPSLSLSLLFFSFSSFRRVTHNEPQDFSLIFETVCHMTYSKYLHSLLLIGALQVG